MRFLSLLTFLAALTASCGQSQIPIKDVRNVPPNSGPPEYYFDGEFPGISEFEQGISRSIEVISHVSVPVPGVPVVSFSDLPSGATFDGKSITWTPPCGEFPDFYKREIGMHYLVATLKSSLDDEQFIQQKMAFIVYKFKEYPDRKCGEALYEQ